VRGKPAPIGHGEPPPVRLTTASWQQPVNRQQIYMRLPWVVPRMESGALPWTAPRNLQAPAGTGTC